MAIHILIWLAATWWVIFQLGDVLEDYRAARERRTETLAETQARVTALVRSQRGFA